MARVQLELSTREIQRLNGIMEACDMGNRKELFSHAFMAFEWMVEEVQNGREIASISSDSTDHRILSLPSLSAAAHQASDDSGNTTDNLLNAAKGSLAEGVLSPQGGQAPEVKAGTAG